jgi:tripartite-type tricarboxylate transporter receptor subunit TctC
MATAAARHTAMIAMLAFATVAWLAGAGPAQTQGSPDRVAPEKSYPERPIRIIVPSGPGGPGDIMARLVAERLQPALGQTVTVEDRIGASGAIGARAAAAAEPDGYTLMLGFTSALTIIPAIMRNSGFDAQRSFTAVARLSDSPPVVVVPAKFPAGSLAEFIGLAKANPGKFFYSSAGLGNQIHLTGELFNQSAGIDVVHVPYKSGAELTTALLAGQADITFLDISLALPLIQEGRLKPLAVVSPVRRAELPGVPTMAEYGFGEFRSSFWTGIVAPAGTPPGIVAKLNAAVNGLLKSADMRATLARLGVEAKPGTPQEFAAFIASETEKWSAIAERAGIRID